MKIKEFIQNNFKWIVLFVCIIAIITIVEDVLDKEIAQFDMTGYKIVSTCLISDFTTPIAKVITQFGGAIILILLAVILSILIKNKKIAVYIWGNLGIITILNQALKHIIQRPRPTEFRIIDEGGYSFPSGHSMVSAAFYGFLIYLIYKNIKNKKLKYGLIIALTILILLIGTSRVFLGVHYTSDVIAGFLISIAYLILYTQIIRDKIQN